MTATTTHAPARETLTACQRATAVAFHRLNPRQFLRALEQYRESQGEDAAQRVARAVRGMAR